MAGTKILCNKSLHGWVPWTKSYHKTLKCLWTRETDEQILHWKHPSHRGVVASRFSPWLTLVWAYRWKWPPVHRKFKEAFQIRGKTSSSSSSPCCLPSYCVTYWLGWFWSGCEGQGFVTPHSLSPFPWQKDHLNRCLELSLASRGLWAGKRLGHFVS